MAGGLATGAESPEKKSEPKPKPKPAVLKVSGYGLLGNLRLKNMLKLLLEEPKKPEFFGATFIEDSALLLASRLNHDGYLQPVITARVTLEDGRVVTFTWRGSVAEPLPQSLRARRVEFKLAKGVLFRFQSLEFSGLEAIPEKKARSYFVETGGLVSLKQNRIYSPDRFKRSMENLADQLQRMGYQDVKVDAERLERDDHTGNVIASVRVVEGPKFILRSVRQEIFPMGATQPESTLTNLPNRPYSRLWEQDFAQSIRTNYYRRGYPDTAVELSILGREAVTNEIQLDMLAVVRPGPRIRTGKVIFTGAKRTRESVLEKRAPLKEGELLNRLQAEHSRDRLSRLGIFDSVELNYTNVDEQTRNVIYRLKEGKQVDVSLLLGWGSYEMLRGGVQIEQFNVFGRAHYQQLKLAQSFKSSSADYLYTLPEVYGEDVDAFLNASGLKREEISFTRIEYGGGAGLVKHFRRAATDVSLAYNYSILKASDLDTNTAPLGVQNPGVGAVIGNITHDRRDSPLYPHRGYKLFANFEIASEYLASDVNYQRVVLSGSYHLPVSDSQWLHLGLSHGFVATAGSTAEDLPFNRRFFPGGENSVRGYQEGEAAPRDPVTGKIVGAETYLLGNVEFEQGITPQWSVVVFVDSVTFAERLADYPGNEALYSVGGGLRWKTFIGPVRLEYGYNLNPRRRDPTGTLQFSLGFPF